MSEEKQLSTNLQEIVEKIEKLSVLELSDLVKALEEKFGVTAAMPMTAMPMAANGAAGAAEQPKEEKDTFDVVLSSFGTNKIAVIKAVREVNPALGLKEAKDLVEAAPKPVKEGASKKEAEEIKQKLEAAGAKVDLK